MRDEPEEERERNAEEKTSDNGKVKRRVFAAVNDVAGEFSQAEGEFVSEIEKGSEKDEESPEEKKRATEFAEGVHELILPEGASIRRIDYFSEENQRANRALFGPNEEKAKVWNAESNLGLCPNEPAVNRKVLKQKG